MSCRLRLQIYELFKSDFLRVPRIGRHSRKIDFSFISPKHSVGWTCSRKNCLKFQRFILRPKFKKVWNLHPMAVFASSNLQNFTPFYDNSGGVKTILWKQSLAQILFYSYTLESCNKFFEVLFVAFSQRVFAQPPFLSLGKERIKANFDQYNWPLVYIIWSKYLHFRKPWLLFFLPKTL